MSFATSVKMAHQNGLNGVGWEEKCGLRNWRKDNRHMGIFLIRLQVFEFIDEGNRVRRFCFKQSIDKDRL